MLTEAQLQIIETIGSEIRKLNIFAEKIDSLAKEGKTKKEIVEFLSKSEDINETSAILIYETAQVYLKHF
jgi:hypothetical protein